MQRNFDVPTIVKIEKVIDETPTVRTLVFSDEVLSNVLPGQFAMVWIPGINELPMSVMIYQEKSPLFFYLYTIHLPPLMPHSKPRRLKYRRKAPLPGQACAPY